MSDYNPYEETITALEEELEEERKRSAKCRIAKSALQSTLDNKNTQLRNAAFTLEQASVALADHLIHLQEVMDLFKKIRESLDEEEGL